MNKHGSEQDALNISPLQPIVIMSKNTTRHHIRRLRDQLSPDAIEKAHKKLIIQLLQHQRFIHSQHIALYRAIHNEIDPSALLYDPRCQDKDFYLPRITPQKRLDFVQVDKNTRYQRNHYGIEEPISGGYQIPPDALDMVLVPTLALNTSGYRLGYGGGYYDQTFQDNPPYLLALIYDFQRDAVFTEEAHDLRCDDNICLAVSRK